MTSEPRRKLPAVTAVLAELGLRSPAATAAVRAELAAVRAELPDPIPTVAEFAARAATRLAADAAPRLRPVINATGVVLHTNLGRSPLHAEAVVAVTAAASGYLNLEVDLTTGKRNKRQDPVRAGLCHLTGAEAATVVNNCAAATVLVLRALAAGREVVVSRGQLIEIGGGFRLPEVMAVSGATLREVGTTNITRVADYERAVGPNTAMLLRVHTSNYRVRGFTKSVSVGELAAVGKRHGIPVVDDCGSGLAVDLAAFGLGSEPLVSAGIAAGADLTLFSGDKLLGGPQAGVIAGRKPLIDRIEADPLFRAVRLDKLSLAALEATLRVYRDPARAIRELPTLRMLTTPLAELRERAARLALRLGGTARDDVGYAGGGTLPDVPLPTAVVVLDEAGLAARLRIGSPAVLGRVKGGKMLLDVRTVFAEQEDDLVAAVGHAIACRPRAHGTQ